MSFPMPNSPILKNHDSLEQEQFLSILSRKEALTRFEAALFPRASAGRTVAARCRAWACAG